MFRDPHRSVNHTKYTETDLFVSDSKIRYNIGLMFCNATSVWSHIRMHASYVILDQLLSQFYIYGSVRISSHNQKKNYITISMIQWSSHSFSTEECKSCRFRILNDDNILFGENCTFNIQSTLSFTDPFTPPIYMGLSLCLFVHP